MWIIFFSFLALLLRVGQTEPTIISEFVTLDPQDVPGSVDKTHNRVTLRINSGDGVIGMDNTRSFCLTTKMATENNQVLDTDVCVTYEDPRFIYTVFLLGWIPKAVYTIDGAVCINRIKELERLTDVFQLAKRLNSTTTAFVGARRRLLASMESGSIVDNAEFLLNGTQEGIDRNDLIIDSGFKWLEDRVSEFQPTLDILAEWNAEIAVLIEQDLQLVGNNSLAENTLRDLEDTFQQIINIVEGIKNNVTNIKNVIDDGGQSVQGATIELARDISTTSSLVTAIGNSTSNQSIVLDNILQGIIEQAEVLVEQINLIRLDIDANLRQSRRFLSSLDDIRLGISNRRLRVEQEFNLKEAIENAGLVPYLSTLNPPQPPSGEVSNTAGLITDLSEFLRVVVTYTTETLASEGGFAGHDDPFLGVPLGTLTGSAGATWNTIEPFLAGPDTAFVHQDVYSMFCDNNFLLENRNKFHTILDIKDFMGPPNCVPGATLAEQANGTIACNCWTRVQHSRCSAINSNIGAGTPFSQTTPLVSLKGQVKNTEM